MGLICGAEVDQEVTDQGGVCMAVDQDKAGLGYGSSGHYVDQGGSGGSGLGMGSVGMGFAVTLGLLDTLASLAVALSFWQFLWPHGWHPCRTWISWMHPLCTCSLPDLLPTQ